MNESRRKLAAIMFTDIVGYASLAQRSESDALKLLEQHRRLLRPVFERFGGKEIKTVGDAFLVEFDNALDAVSCGVAIQRVLKDYNSVVQADSEIRLRIGIHVGDVVETADDIMGDSVNIASRIEPLADPGGICITGEVFSQVRNKVPFSIVPTEPRNLKNIEFPVEVYRVSLDEGQAKEVRTLDRTRLAVIPFANISPDPNDEYFADGMTEELISAMSRLKGLSVISRTSAMRYKGGKKSLGEIGRELNAGTILEGSVRKVRERVRITTQLIDVRSDQNLWTETFDRELEDVFALQSEIARKVADALERRLLARDLEQIVKTGAEKTEAYLLYLKGRVLMNRKTPESIKRAMELFNSAIEVERSYALPYAGLAECFASLGRRGDLSYNEVYPKGMEYARKALELNDMLAEPHAALGGLLAEGEWRMDPAEKEFKRAIELNPSYANAHAWYALFLGHVGRVGEAIVEIKRAIELDPLEASFHRTAAEEYLFSEDYEKVIQEGEVAMELEPSSHRPASNTAFAKLMKGLAEEAVRTAEAAHKHTGGNVMAGELAYFYAKAGHREPAERIVADLKTKLEKGEQTEYPIAVATLGLGRREESLDWFERAYGAHATNLLHLKADPMFKELRNEPRIQVLLKKIGLSQ